MQISHEDSDGVRIISIAGQINGGNAGELEKALLACLENAPKAALDFSGVSYISSAGLRVVLLAAKKLAASSGALALYAMQPAVFEIFEMCGFVDILTIAGTREAALSFCKGVG